jgi:UDP-GlcNAc:undecaprenyl-phosphate GlcNAc-1-phosphate transferase
MIYYYLGFIILNLLSIKYFSVLSKFYNVFDLPDSERKIHKKPVSLFGGFLIYLNLFLIFICDLIFEDNLLIFENRDNVIFFLLSSLFFLLGYADDKYSLSANKKLFILLILILSLLFLDNKLLISVLRFSFLEQNLNLGFFSYPFTILCIILFVSAFNMFDGINLQCGLYSLVILVGLKLYYEFYFIFDLMIIFLLFFLYLNFKNKCFLGNSGSHLLAFIFSYFFIKRYNSGIELKADDIFIIMMIPGFELLRLAIFRLLDKRHPFEADKNHLHHFLILKFNFFQTTIIQQMLIISPILLSFTILNSIFVIILTAMVYLFLIFKFRN